MPRPARIPTLLAVCLLVGCAADDVPPYELPLDLTIADTQFDRVLGSMLGPPLVENNHVQTLVNGQEIFPAMLTAIEQATQSITLETYIYWSGDVGRQFTKALIERSRAGVPVHVILDAWGSQKIDDEYLDEMRDAGVQIVQYHKLRLEQLVNPFETPELNYRTHRKIMVVDGRVGFIGGVGIADAWAGDAGSRDQWRDNHYRVEGPAVRYLQAAFADNWTESTGQVFTGRRYLPDLAPAGEHVGQVFISSPEQGGSRSVQLMYLLFFACARHSLDLCSPYFIIDDQTTRVLADAARRGVRVRILTPGPIDQEIASKASRAGWGPLLEAGVEIYEYQPAMLHTKLMIADDLWVSVGSTNLDNRSFHLNDEANLNVRDRAFALHSRELFERDLAKSKRVTLEQWRNRPLHEKLMELLASLLGPQL